jgi:hypothetical protein
MNDCFGGLWCKQSIKIRSPAVWRYFVVDGPVLAPCIWEVVCSTQVWRRSTADFGETKDSNADGEERDEQGKAEDQAFPEFGGAGEGQHVAGRTRRWREGLERHCMDDDGVAHANGGKLDLLRTDFWSDRVGRRDEGREAELRHGKGMHIAKGCIRLEIGVALVGTILNCKERDGMVTATDSDDGLLLADLICAERAYIETETDFHTPRELAPAHDLGLAALLCG